MTEWDGGSVLIAAVVLTAVVLAACDVDFVEVQTSRAASVIVQGDHADALRAEVRVIHQGVEGPVSVRVEGAEATAVAGGPGDWRHEASVVVDSLDATVNLSLEAGGRELPVDVPLVARRGSALRSEEGDLHLPAAHEDLLSARRVLWIVELVDSEEHSLVRIQSEAPLPDPLVISGSLVPAEAVRAHLTHLVSAEIEDGAYPVIVAVTSNTSWVVP